ncbi:MAG TPA: hypothetical protein VMU89_04965 [Thermomicrobiaceae bacterium]|nr:hypothetical protein [Thermomicrobiaceae bacterium]
MTESTLAHISTGRGPGGHGPACGCIWWVALNGELLAGTAMPDGSCAAYGNPYFVRKRWDYFVRHLLGAEPPAYHLTLPLD